MENNNNQTNQVPQQPYQQPVYYGPQKQNIALCIILSFLTCGIYMYYWIYRMTEDLNLLNNNPNGTSGGVVVLLSIVTCGIYEYYWLYKQGEAVDQAKTARGISSSNNGLVYLLLGIFGFAIVSLGLMQNEINSMAQG